MLWPSLEILPGIRSFEEGNTTRVSVSLRAALRCSTPRENRQVLPPALTGRVTSYPVVNQIVHPPEVEAASSSDTELVGIGRVEAEERHVARKNGFDNLYEQDRPESLAVNYR